MARRGWRNWKRAKPAWRQNANHHTELARALVAVFRPERVKNHLEQAPHRPALVMVGDSHPSLFQTEVKLVTSRAKWQWLCRHSPLLVKWQYLWDGNVFSSKQSWRVGCYRQHGVGRLFTAQIRAFRAVGHNFQLQRSSHWCNSHKKVAGRTMQTYQSYQETTPFPTTLRTTWFRSQAKLTPQMRAPQASHPIQWWPVQTLMLY